jgi:hypothetical protein
MPRDRGGFAERIGAVGHGADYSQRKRPLARVLLWGPDAAPARPSWTEIDLSDHDRAVALEAMCQYLVSRYVLDFLTVLLKNTLQFGWAEGLERSSVALADRPFNEKLRTASVLEVRGEGATLHVPLDKSTAALERLELCFEKNGREGPETNPFVAPNRTP